MEFRQIMYFDAAYRSNSISKAAQELFVTQQCVSKQISMLEKEIGVPLLVRKQNGVVPTEEGRWFHEHASMILQIERDIQSHFELHRKGTPKVLKVGVSNGLNLFYDDSFFNRLREKYPEQSIQVFYMWNRQIEDMLESDMIDIGISLLPIQNESLYVEKLFAEPICCIVNSCHRLAGRDVLHFEDILQEQIAMADENFNTYQAFLKRCEDEGVTPNIYKSSDLMSIYVYVLNHNTVGFSLKAFADRFHIDQIRYIPYDDVGGTWEVCVLTKEDNAGKHKNLFYDFASAHRTYSVNLQG